MVSIKDFSDDKDKNSNNGSNNSTNNGGTGLNLNGLNLGGGTAPQQGYDITDFLIDHTNTKNHDTILYRDEDIERIVTILSNTRQSNVLLVGEAGTGKTAIIKEIGRLLKGKTYVTQMLGNDIKLYELDLHRVVGGAKFAGEVEERVKQLVEIIDDCGKNAIFYLDEAHRLYNDTDPIMSKVAEGLKPILGQNQTRFILSTTTQEARLSIEKDSAIKRRFMKYVLKSLTNVQTCEVVARFGKKLEQTRNVLIPDSLYPQIVAQANQHFKYMARPNNALSLLDTSISQLKSNWIKLSIANPTAYANLMQQAVATAVTTQNTTAQPMQQPPVVLNIDLVKQTAKNIASNGANTNGDVDVSMIQPQVKKYIKGQEKAVENVVAKLKRKVLAFREAKRPLSMLFTGPTGTGKTEMAKTIAKVLFENEQQFIHINMNEYQNSSALTRLLGASEGYIGSNSKRPLPLDKLEENPYQVVLLDEFEKAHEMVQLAFMQALDEGELQTNRGNTIQFNQAIVIATTNAGVEELTKSRIGFGGGTMIEESSTDEVIQALSQEIKPELLNRFTDIIPFMPLTIEEYKTILKMKYSKITAEITEMQDNYYFPTIDFDKNYEEINQLAEESYDPLLNGRPAERSIEEWIENLLVEEKPVTLTEI